jgi:hypothetical protein
MKGESMLRNINCLVIALLILGVMNPGLSLGEEKQPKLDKKTRETIHYVLTIELEDGIEKAFSEPIENIREKILTSVEQKNGIKIDRSSMVRVDKCLRTLLTSIPHLAKISTGNTVIRAQIALDAETSQKSVWTQWKTRKLETPELKMTLFYENKTVEPTEFICSGHKYH